MTTPQTPAPRAGRPPEPPERRASSHIHLRSTRGRKAAYVRAACASSSTLAAWAFRALDAAAQYQPAPE